MLRCVLSFLIFAVASGTSPLKGFFMLQESNDGLCLGGDNASFKRCAIDTLWYTSGKAGKFHIMNRAVDENLDDLCLSKANCLVEEADVRLAGCSHCGAQRWDVTVIDQTGLKDHIVALTKDQKNLCLQRNDTKATLISCKVGYTPLVVIPMKMDKITALTSIENKIVNEAFLNNTVAVKTLIKSGVDVNSKDWDDLTPLSAASAHGNLELVTFLVDNGADVNIADRNNVTALMGASVGNFLDVVEYLVSNGAVVDALAESSVSSLYLAAERGHSKIVNFLLEHGADPHNSNDFNEQTSLFVACTSGSAETVALLLAANASVNDVDVNGVIPIHVAAEQGSAPIVEMLLKDGANANAITTTGYTSLIIAAAHGHMEVVKLLVNHQGDINYESPNDGATPLMYAAAGIDDGTGKNVTALPDIVKFLIQSGADVNRKHKGGGTALIEAAQAGNLTVFTYLLEAGSDPFIVDEDGLTALMAASGRGNLDIVKVLIDKGLDVNKIGESGGTAVVYAASDGHLEVVKVLIAAKADVNVVVKGAVKYIDKVRRDMLEGKDGVEPHVDGITALHLAAQKGHFETVKLLVESNANVNVYDEFNSSPLIEAMKGGHYQIASYLVENGATTSDSYVDIKTKHKHNILMDAISSSQSELVTALLAKNVDVSYRDEEGISIAAQAAHKGQYSIIKTVIEKDIPITTKEDDFHPLIIAASEGHDDIINLLLDSGKVSIDTKDPDGTTALMAASVRGHKNVINTLLSRKVDVNAQNVNGHTALMFAYNGRNQVNHLIDKYSEYIQNHPSGQMNNMSDIKNAQSIHSEIVTLLLKYGADTSIKSREGHIAKDFD